MRVNYILSFAVAVRDGDYEPTIEGFTDFKNNKLSLRNCDIFPEIVMDFYDIKIEKLIGRSRKRELVQARQILMKLYKERSTLSLSEIGHMFNRDHSTVLYGVKTIEKLIEVDPAVRKDWAAITEIL